MLQQVTGEHGQVLVEELEAALVVMPLAMALPTWCGDHIEVRPAILGVGAG